MLKHNITNGILALMTSLGCMQANAWSDSNSIYIPELGRYVHVDKKSSTKEYAVNYGDLVEVSFKLIGSFDTSTCTDWRRTLSQVTPDPETDVSLFQRSQVQLQIQLFQIRPSAIASAIGSDWSDVSDLAIQSLSVQPTWESSALTPVGGPRVKAGAIQEIESNLNSGAARQALKSTGRVRFNITNSLMACDLIEGNVNLTLNAVASRSTSFHSPAVTKASDLVAISQRVQDASSLLKSENNPLALSDSLRALNAAGLLGFQLQQQGVGPEVFKNGEFIKMFDKIFPTNALSPVALTQDEAVAMTNSMRVVKFESTSFSISKPLTLILE